MNDNYFNKLNTIDVSDKIDKKGKLSYLSWAWAWAELKKAYPDANSKVYEQDNGLNYWHDDKTAWVKASVTINDIEHIEYLPIMDFKNQSIKVNELTSTDVNKAIQRCITKAIARHGLGLYIYAGEDLPEEDEEEKKAKLELEAKETKARKYVNRTMKELMTKLNTNDREVAYKHLGIDSHTFLDKYNHNIIDLGNKIYAILNPQEEASKEVNVT